MKQTGFIAGQDGSVVKYDPKVHAPIKSTIPRQLTRHQRAALYFMALRHIKSLLQSVGFHQIADCGHGAFCIEMDGFILEMAVQKGPRIAYVTSHPGYEYDPNKITAKVTHMGPTDNAKEYVIRIIATSSKGMTQAPVYVVVNANAPDMLKDAFLNCLISARDFMRCDPRIMAKIQAAMAQRDIDADFEKLRQADP